MISKVRYVPLKKVLNMSKLDKYLARLVYQSQTMSTSTGEPIVFINKTKSYRRVVLELSNSDRGLLASVDIIFESDDLVKVVGRYYQHVYLELDLLTELGLQVVQAFLDDKEDEDLSVHYKILKSL